MTHPDVASVRREAREEWNRQFKRSKSIEEWIGDSTPWWIVVVAAVFFALSVPHTMVIFDKITPTWGKVAPFGIEFGLLFSAFRRRIGKMTLQLWILEVLLFLTAIIVNGAGSLEAVVKSTESVQGQSIEMLIKRLPDLPATSQVALVLVPMAALIIPIGTVAAGENLAQLVTERRSGTHLKEQRWKDEGMLVEYEALRDADIAAGHTPNAAAKWAAQITGFDAPQVSIRSSRTHTDTRTDAPTRHYGQRRGRNADARQQVRDLLEQHPEMAALPVREVAKMANAGKSIAAEEMSAFKAQHNRNGHREG